MNPLTLKLRHREAPSDAPNSWFLPFTDPGECLAEISRWPVKHEELRLFSVPRSVQDRSPVGLLVVLPSPLAITQTRALPLRVLAGRLYLPMDAELFPPVAIEELNRVCLFPVLLFHPATGLIGFDENSGFCVADLLQRPEMLSESWNAAHPGVNIPPSLGSIELEMPQSFEELFGDSSQEIGSEKDTALPPAPDEPGPAGKIVRKAGLLLSASLAGAMKILPSGGTNQFLEKVQNWANAKARQLSHDLESLRHKEIGRLLHMLESDPDSGLRHALPMNRLGGRGLTRNPGARLSPHGLNFSLSGLGGGLAADPWYVSAEIQQRLSAKYRELANREMKLGRYRRAAYIFAELLGDLSSAAAALKQGKHYREAAVIYKDHLHSPVVAAECLAEGGLFADALAIYIDREMFIEAAHLYRKLGIEEQAAKQFRKAVEQRLRNHNPLSAARLLDTELNSPEEALTVLRNGWREGHEATDCLEAYFKLLTRLGSHDRALKLLHELRDEEMPPLRTQGFVRVVVNAAMEYPEREVRRFAADLARVKAATRLLQADSDESRTLIQLLNKLVPEDRLFLRDGNRFIAAKKENQRTKARNQKVDPAAPPILVRSFDLPGRYQWFDFRADAKHLFALGFNEENAGARLVLIRATWEGVAHGMSWDVSASPAPRCLFEVEAQERWVILHPCGEELLVRQLFPISDHSLHATSCGTPAWLPPHTLGLVRHHPFIWLVRAEEHFNDLVLECRESSGALISNLDLPQLGAVNRPLKMAAGNSGVAISGGAGLLVRDKDGTIETLEFDQSVCSIAMYASAPQLCLAIALESKALIYTQGTNEPQLVADDLDEPLAVFTSNGTLVVGSGNEGRIYQFIPGGIRRASTFRWPSPDIVALIPGPVPDQFAAISSRGTVRLFKLR